MQATLEQINTFPGFRKLTDTQKQSLCTMLEYREIEPGENVPNAFQMRIGDFADHLYFLLSGELRFYYEDAGKHKFTTHCAQPGDVFGEVGMLLDIKRRTAHVETTKSGAVLSLRHDKLNDLLKECPEAGKLIMERMAFRLANSAHLLEGSIRPLKETNQEARTKEELKILRFVQWLGSRRTALWTALVIAAWLILTFIVLGIHDFAGSAYALLGLLLSIAAFVFGILILINQNRETREQEKRDERIDVLMLAILQHSEGSSKMLRQQLGTTATDGEQYQTAKQNSHHAEQETTA